MKTLRTPDQRFENLPGYPFAPHYTEVPDGDGGKLRIHHLDEGPADGAIVLCMHGQPSWSYLYRNMIPGLVDAGLRVIAPDLVGYGRSDKPAALEDYSYQAQVDWMNAWLRQNEFSGITFFGQDWGGLIGLRMVAENPERFARVVVANTGLPLPIGVSAERNEALREWRRTAPTPTMPEVMEAITKGDPETPERAFGYWQKWCWESEDMPVSLTIAGMVPGLTPEEVAAYDAPFPNASYKMGCRAMPSQVPTTSDDPSIEANRRAWEVFSKWDKPFLTSFSNDDPVTRGGDAIFQAKVPGAKDQPHVTIQGGGHFLQDRKGAELADIVAKFVKAN